MRDLIAVLEAMNVIDFPNDSGQHPVHSYEKWSTPLRKYADDFDKPDGQKKTYPALLPLLVDALDLFDRVRHDFRLLYNEHVSAAGGRLKIVEEASTRQGAFDFLFSDQPRDKYRLTKGATYPIFAAFRNCVAYDLAKHEATWIGGYPNVRNLWDEVGPELVKETAAAIRQNNNPDALGKNRNHWANLHRLMENKMLRQQLKLAQSA